MFIFQRKYADKVGRGVIQKTTVASEIFDFCDR